ncbi:MAG: hypothetical protein P8N72_09245 [Flavimaricola sp.]|nr:hypothetical protein [Flavimaricola sp.]
MLLLSDVREFILGQQVLRRSLIDSAALIAVPPFLARAGGAGPMTGSLYRPAGAWQALVSGVG